jgi:hypothetical protein
MHPLATAVRNDNRVSAFPFVSCNTKTNFYRRIRLDYIDGDIYKDDELTRRPSERNTRLSSEHTIAV